MNRRKLDLTTHQAAIREADRLHIGGYRKAGKWDLAQTCDHLDKALARSLDGYQSRAFWMLRLLGPLARRRIFKKRAFPTGIKAPAGMIPLAGLNEAQAVAALKATITRVFDAGAIFQEHPMLGNLTAEQNRQLHLIHISHHFSFLIPQDRIVT